MEYLFIADISCALLQDVGVERQPMQDASTSVCIDPVVRYIYVAFNKSEDNPASIWEIMPFATLDNYYNKDIILMSYHVSSSHMLTYQVSCFS